MTKKTSMMKIHLLERISDEEWTTNEERGKHEKKANNHEMFNNVKNMKILILMKHA